MTITTTWSIDDLEYDPSDGFVKNAFWRLEGKNGDTLIHDRGGSAWFAKPASLPSDFIAYESLDEATVLNWVKTLIGTDGVTAIEKVIDDNIAILNTPVTATGKPF